jgi:RND superfamily putative drug exporter
MLRAVERSAAQVSGPGRAARAVVAARWFILAFWLAAVALAAVYLPSLGSNGGAVADIVPKDAPALKAQTEAIHLFGVPVGSDVVTVLRRPTGLTSQDVARNADAARTALTAARQPAEPLRGVIPLVNTPGAGWQERNTTILDYLLVAPSANLADRQKIAQGFARASGATGVTGSAIAQLDQFSDIEDVLPWITIATILVIALVVVAYFRSLLAPLVTLGTAGLAYVVAIHVLAWGGERTDTTIPQEIEPLLIVLLLGLVTDYSVFLLAEMRRQLRLGEEPRAAATLATSRVVPSVLAAGTIVAACSCALLAAHLEFFRSFGPGLAVCALVVTAVAATLVPALLAILGERLFGAATRDPTAPATADAAPQPEPSDRAERWRRRMPETVGAIQAGQREARVEGRSAFGPVTARMLASRPAAAVLVLVCVAGLGWAASVARQADLGVAFIAGLPASSDARQASDDATRGFVGGIVAPTDVILQGPGVGTKTAALARLTAALQRRPHVAATLGPAAQLAFAPSADDPHPLAAKSGDAARVIVVHRGDPTSAATLGAFRDLRAAMPALLRSSGLPPSTRVTYAGETALGAESVDAVTDDFVRIAIAIAAVTLLLLVVFLRALLAPVLLLAASALGYLAALGLTTLAVRAIYGDTQITYYVPLVGAVLLVALGSDYNVLVAGRIRAESARRRSREALAVAVPQASRAITLAGLTLGGSFAMLAIVPLRSFRELALLLTIGVLLDTVVVRSILVPGLMSLAGEGAWWPGNPRERVEEDAVLPRVARDLRITPDAALPLTVATLHVLGERIGDDEAAELARHLPRSLVAPLTDPADAEPFDAAEFVHRVAQRTDASDVEARRTTIAVLRAIVDVVPPTEFDYVRATLSEDYLPLLESDPAPRPQAASA